MFIITLKNEDDKEELVTELSQILRDAGVNHFLVAKTEEHKVSNSMFFERRNFVDVMASAFYANPILMTDCLSAISMVLNRIKKESEQTRKEPEKKIA